MRATRPGASRTFARIVLDTLCATRHYKGALAFFLLAAPALGQAGMTAASAGAIGCVSKESLWAYVDAREANDREALRELNRGSCRLLGGAPYSLIEVHNGTAKILVFKAPGAWERAQALFTLEEMLQPEEPTGGST